MITYVNGTNQCDGCKRKLRLRGHIHIDTDGHAVMYCEKDKYKQECKPDENTTSKPNDNSGGRKH